MLCPARKTSKVNGYALEKLRFALFQWKNERICSGKIRRFDFIHFYVLLGTNGHQKETIFVLMAADCNPGKLNGYAPEYVVCRCEICTQIRGKE